MPTTSDANFLQRFPWLTLALLLATHITFGWFVAASTSETHWQWLGAGLVCAINLALLSPIGLVEICFGSWLQSDRKASITIISAAFVLVLALRWIDWFLRFTFLISAGILANLDLRSAGYNRWVTFAIASALGLGGYRIGLQLQTNPTLSALLGDLFA